MARALSGLALAAALLSPGHIEAQALTDDISAYPIRTIITPNLWAGYLYEFRTFDIAGTEDTVLSLRSGAYTPLAPSLAGADGCLPYGGGAFAWEPSCFTYTPTTDGTRTLVLYAYTELTYGVAQVQYRNITTGGAWTNLGGGLLSFGGSRGALNAAAGTGRVRLETTGRPGNVGGHIIVVANAADLGETRYVGVMNSARVPPAAQFDVDLAANGLAPGDWWVYFAPAVAGATGDTRLVRNDFFVPGADWDQDGLSLALESDVTGSARVGTCDRPTQVLPTFDCRYVGAASHPECLISTDPECADALRDTDHDGLRDDLEVFGGGTYLEFPRYGADPAHFDVFVEMDVYDQVPGGTGACDALQNASVLAPNYFLQFHDNDNVATPTITHFHDSMALVYGDAPAWMSPDGTAGIRLHHDLGLSNPSNARETRYGAWGSGNQCVAGLGTCSPADLFWDNCGTTTFFPPERRWNFQYALDAPVVSGNGGTASAPTYYGITASDHVHELGHTLLLEHPGPHGAAAATLGTAGYGNTWHTGNWRPAHPSRMNYRYVFMGGTDGMQTYNDWADFNFSPGVLTVPLSNSEAPELCPFPGRSQSDLWFLRGVSFSTSDDVATAPPHSSCPTTAGVDWNADGSISGTNHIAVSEFLHSERRMYIEPGTAGTFKVGPDSATIVNDVLLTAYGYCPTGAPPCSIRLRGDGTDSDCNIMPILPDSATFDLATGSYPGCFGHGTAVASSPVGWDARHAAITGFRSDGGTGTPNRAAVLFTRDTGAIYVSTFNPASITGGAEFTGAPSSYATSSVIAGTSGFFQDIGVARVPGTNTLLIAYSTDAGQLRQVSLDPVAGTWSSWSASVELGGAALATGASSPGLAVIDGRVWMARFSAPSFGIQYRIELYRLQDTGIVATRRWELMTTIVPPGGSMVPGSTPSLVAAAPYDAIGTQVWVYARDGMTGFIQTHRAPVSATWWLGTFTNVAFFNAFENGTIGSAAAVWDARSSLPFGSAGLRLYQSVGAGSNYLRLNPFANGADPSYVIDYSDWQGIQFGSCHIHEFMSGAAPGPNFLRPTGWNDVDRCGDLPNVTEPVTGGTTVTSRGNGHRAAHPDLYLCGALVDTCL